MKRFYKKEKRIRYNQYIRIPEVRVIDEHGKQLGVMRTDDAQKLAEERGFDLVEVAAKERPPICRIMNYGQYKYQKEREERKMKKKQKKIEVKGVRISPRISKNDLMFKAKMADKFLKQGHKVRIEMIIKGREYTHMDLINETFNKFLKILKTKVVVEQGKKKQRLGMAMVVAPE